MSPSRRLDWHRNQVTCLVLILRPVLYVLWPAPSSAASASKSNHPCTTAQILGYYQFFITLLAPLKTDSKENTRRLPLEN